MDKIYDKDGALLQYGISPNEYIEDKAVDTKSSYFANWEVISTLPRSHGGKFSFRDFPYKSR